MTDKAAANAGGDPAPPPAASPGGGGAPAPGGAEGVVAEDAPAAGDGKEDGAGPASRATPADRGEHEIQTELSRDLGLVSVLAIGVGTMIAAGIFTLSGLAIREVGSAAIAAFLLAAVVASFTALTYCEFSSIYPQSGEGYLYARKTYPPPLAYMVGWCLLLGYTSSCGFYLASFASYFNEFIFPALHHTRLELISGLAALVALTLLNIKGTKESGSFQVAVTVGKVLLLIWFVGGGLGHVELDVIREKFSTDMLKIGSTAALVFITFFGFSAIAASAGEVKNPTRTIPRAIFISMGLVTVLYTVVVLVVVAAGLHAYDEAAMGQAARKFLGPVGGMVIVAGALFSMISASNASILAGSRVALSMSRLGHLPEEIGSVNVRTRTPVVALMLVGGGIGAFCMFLPLEELAHFADCVLLIALILVNGALIVHRGKYPGMQRPFRVPLVPVLPGLGIAANVYLLIQTVQHGHFESLGLALFSLVLGFCGYLAWKGTQAEAVALPGSPSRVALERKTGGEGRFRVLVPLANPANVEPLIDLAAAIASQRDGEIVALRVAVVPEQLPPALEEEHVEREGHILDAARARAITQGVPVTSLIRIGHNPARAILETSSERHCDLILLGWKGFTSTARRILGEVTDAVVTHARTDIMLVKLADDARPLRRLLLPSAGGDHAKQATEYAADIAQAQGGSLTLCSVVAPGVSREQAESEQARLSSARAELDHKGVDTRLIRHASVPMGIISAAEGEGYDAIVVGAANQSFTSQVLFGSIPEDIVRQASRTVIMVKHHQPVKALLGRVMSE